MKGTVILIMIGTFRTITNNLEIRLGLMEIRGRNEFFFIIQRVKNTFDTCPHQPPTKGDTTVLVAKAVLLPLAPPAAFATVQAMKKTQKVPLCSL